jgi:hypothetical protein
MGRHLKEGICANLPKLCQQYCCHYPEYPSSVLQFFDTWDKKIIRSVSQYFNAIQCLTNFLPECSSWLINVAQHFFDHLLVNIHDQMKGQGHNYDQGTVPRAPFAQISALQNAFSATILAEMNLQ